MGEREDGIFIQVQWTGVPDKQSWIWNELNELVEDLPEKGRRILKTQKGQDRKKGANRIGTEIMCAFFTHHAAVQTPMRL